MQVYMDIVRFVPSSLIIDLTTVVNYTGMLGQHVKTAGWLFAKHIVFS